MVGHDDGQTAGGNILLGNGTNRYDACSSLRTINDWGAQKDLLAWLKLYITLGWKDFCTCSINDQWCRRASSLSNRIHLMLFDTDSVSMALLPKQAHGIIGQ